MSAEELSKLSLVDKMVTTRAGAAKARASGVEQHYSESPPSPPLSSIHSASPTPSVIESTSGIKYDLSSFETEVRRRAKQGLMDNDIKMKYCRLLDDKSNQYLFCLDDEVQIAVGGRYSVPKCTCGANEKGIACKHIFWMSDQLASKASTKIRGQTLEVAADGSSIQDKELAEIIDNATLERVAKSLDWVLHEGPIPEDEDIEDEVAEMLSVFEPSEALPSEFKNQDDSFLTERSRKYRGLMDLLTELFTEDPTKNLGFLNRLQALLDLDFQAQVFFEKINNRVVGTFKALDEYIANGSAGAHAAHDVPTCAEKLKALVRSIDEYYHQKENNGYDTHDIALRAVAVLIRILDGVVRRNHDAYANITWAGVPPENPEENNLFVCLIGRDTGELFVLDVLRSLPIHDITLRNHWESLSYIYARLNPQWTPKPFMDVFRTFMSEGRKRASSESGGSSAKRTMK